MAPPKLLLIEDNPDDEALTLRALKTHDICNDIDIVRDGRAALDYLRREGEYAGRPKGEPTVVLLDLNLPKISGLEVLKELRAHDKTKLLPVVVLTTSTEDRDKVESYRLGANSYVRKPVAFAEFSEAVHRLGLFWLLVNQSPPEDR